jgi:isocitrate dehydrogenase kinase/phosphatase
VEDAETVSIGLLEEEHNRPPVTADGLAAAVHAAFVAWHAEFAGMTRRARGRFARREWRAAREDAAERLELYGVRVRRVVNALLAAVEPAPPDDTLWRDVKDAFGARADGRPDAELAETFFNSVVRRVRRAPDVDPASEFVRPALASPRDADSIPLHLTFEGSADIALRRALGSLDLGAPWADLGGDARLGAAALVAQLECGARFEPSEGDRGMVMAVFALPALNVVFKIIRDRFDHPKRTTRREVMERYDLVFRHDRVGRLADAQEFARLEFRREHFDPRLLAELIAAAGDTVTVHGDLVRVAHAYTERRVTPLNLFLRTAGAEAARDAVLDYGNAIKDLAAANIFPGDMLLKNFGVTRHGRVIFYDYDELSLLTDCRFRRIPPPRDDDDELSAEPWFHVGDHDVFPEEFGRFALLPGGLGEAFLAEHGDLFGVEFWEAMQRRQQEGEIVDFFPYRPHRRLRRS